MTTAPEAPRRRTAPRVLALCAGVVVLVAALVLLVVSHQPSAAAASGHLHGPADGVATTSVASGVGEGHAHAAQHAPHPVAPAPGDGGPTHDHDHETLVACTLLAALTMLALRRLQPRPARGAGRAPSAGRPLAPVVLRSVRPPGAPDLLALGISRT